MVLPELSPHPARELLKREKISPFRVAKLLGIRYAALWEILSGIRPPSPDQAEKLNELVTAIESGEVKHD